MLTTCPGLRCGVQTRVLISVGASLTVRGGGTLHAVGTETNPIVFDAAEPGTKWGGILIENYRQAAFEWAGPGHAVVFDSASPTGNVLAWCVIENGGDTSRGFDGSVILKGGRPLLYHVTISGSGGECHPAMFIDPGILYGPPLAC